MKTLKLSLLAGVIFVAMNSFALGVPVWRTSPPGMGPTTFQHWTFDTNDSVAVIPEVYTNAHGTPTADITATGDIHDPAGWYDEYLGEFGVWHADTTTATLYIPNNPVTNDYKEIWVEVGFRGILTDYSILDPTAGITFLGQNIEGIGWKTLTIGWRIEPNPDEETIYLEFHDSGADIDYIIVDTICIPEPMTLSLLGLGGLFVMRKFTTKH